MCDRRSPYARDKIKANSVVGLFLIRCFVLRTTTTHGRNTRSNDGEGNTQQPQSDRIPIVLSQTEQNAWSVVHFLGHVRTHPVGGKESSKQQRVAASAEHRVTRDTPPIFLTHHQFDGVSSLNSTVLAQAATKMKVPCELHLYPQGGHGFGMGVKGKHLSADWPNLLEQFIKRIPIKK